MAKEIKTLQTDNKPNSTNNKEPLISHVPDRVKNTVLYCLFLSHTHYVVLLNTL